MSNVITIKREMGTPSWTVDGATKLAFGSKAKIETVFNDYISMKTIEVDGNPFDVILKHNEIRFIPAH